MFLGISIHVVVTLSEHVLISSPIGSIHFFGILFAPNIIPKVAPTVAEVQSPSSPQPAAIQILLPKSPSP